MENENTWIVVVIAILAFFLFGGFGIGMMPHRDYGQWGAYWTGGWGWMGIFMWLIWLLIIVFLVLGIIWFVKQINKK